MADIKWIKITTDIFDDEKIKIIDTYPARDEILVIWFKLLSLAGKVNQSGLLFMSNRIAYTVDMLAAVFNREQKVVEMALGVFQKFGMISVEDNDVIAICNWEKHQNVDGMDKIREQNRLRKSNEREKKKLLIESRDSHVTVTQCHAIDKEEDKDKEEESKKSLGVIDQIKTSGLSPELQDKLRDWVLYKSEKRDSYKPTGFKSLLSQIRGKVDQYGEQAVMDLINDSMANNWKGIIWDRIQTKGKCLPKRDILMDIISEGRNGQERNCTDYEADPISIQRLLPGRE